MKHIRNQSFGILAGVILAGCGVQKPLDSTAGPDTSAEAQSNEEQVTLSPASSTRATAAAKAGTGSVGIPPASISEYKIQIGQTLKEVKESRFSNGRAKRAAYELARDLEVEVNQAEEAKTPEEVETARQRIEQGIERLASYRDAQM